MLRIDDRGTSLCDGLTRREWLRIGGLGMGGLTLPTLLRARLAQAATLPPTRGRARSCIVLFFLGGPPQHETWDPKPLAPAEIRGPLNPIASAIPGVHVGELMPRTAGQLDKICVLRAVTTNDNAHSASGYYMTTGVPHQPMNAENARVGAPNDWPCLGALVRRVLPGDGRLPAAITLPEQSANDGNLTWPGQDAGFLGRAADPWLLTCTPEAADFQVPGLGLPPDISGGRFEGRTSLLERVDRGLDGLANSAELGLFDAQQRQALELIAGSQARRAFNLREEPARLRDRYGRTRFGQSCLLARRLVEAGVPLVRVNWTRVAGALNNGHWDTHSRNADALRQLMPIMDQTYSALLEDLAQRGLLDETLVVWMAEFGRTPRLNGAAGRDHWGSVFSVALAGGGIRGGMVHGASDSIAAYPRDGRVLPQDLLATIFHCLGIRSETEYRDAQGRPLPLTRGEVVRQILL
jgi:hypothetical protein